MEVTGDFLRSRNINLDEVADGHLPTLKSRGRLTAEPPNSVPQYLLWRPHSPERRRTTVIVSSRLGRALDRKDAFFRSLRIACSQLDPQKQLLLSAQGIATHRFVARAAELFGIDVQTVEVADKGQALTGWLRELVNLTEIPSAVAAYASPALPDASVTVPIRDLAVVSLADQVLALHARNRGSIQTLLANRLSKQNHGNQGSHGRVFLAVGGEDLVPSAVAATLMEKGAIGWFVSADGPAPLPALLTSIGNQTPPPIIPIDQLKDPDRFLTHCTRQADGPWPDQTDADFLDELIMGDTLRDRTALAALMRIVGHQQILATGSAIRNEVPVVSLTAVPVDELRTLRRFRPHRGRWDFEPYGVSIDREYLVGQGAQKVIYGDEETWNSLSTADKPFFQKLGKETNSIDWRVEREYRVLQDLNLQTIPRRHVHVFVPSHEEAEHVARISRWPVIVVPPQSAD